MAIVPITFIYQLLLFTFWFVLMQFKPPGRRDYILTRFVSFACLVLLIPITVVDPSYITDITGAWTTITIALPANIKADSVLIIVLLWFVTLLSIWRQLTEKGLES